MLSFKAESSVRRYFLRRSITNSFYVIILDNTSRLYGVAYRSVTKVDFSYEGNETPYLKKNGFFFRYESF